MAEPYLGELRLVGFNYAPKGWLIASGQLLPINQYQALFALLGTYYGGNGVSTFALPNLQGRVMVGQGQSPGLSNYEIGQMGGEATHTLTIAELPSHTHGVNVVSSDADVEDPTNHRLATAPYALGFNSHPSANANMPLPTTNIGGGAAHQNLMPGLGMTTIIAMSGIFPSRP